MVSDDWLSVMPASFKRACDQPMHLRGLSKYGQVGFGLEAI